MEQKFDKQPKLTRRSFLKTMAASTAAASAALSLPGIALSETTDRQIENEQRDFKPFLQNRFNDPSAESTRERSYNRFCNRKT